MGRLPSMATWSSRPIADNRKWHVSADGSTRYVSYYLKDLRWPAIRIAGALPALVSVEVVNHLFRDRFDLSHLFRIVRKLRLLGFF